METKICGKCKKEKRVKCFSKNGNKKYKYHFYCKDCVKAYDHKRYEDNKEAVSTRNNLRRSMIRQKLHDYLLQHPCTDCNEKDIIVLEFDHLKDKEYNVSELVGGAYSWKKIKKEIDKCEVVCANCHKRRTAKRGSWVKAN